MNSDVLSIIEQLDRLPGGIDPAFDDDAGELERQFAELRLNFDNSQPERI
jgi:hypothetical protein